MRFIDKAKQEKVTDEDFEDATEDWHYAGGSLSDFLGVPGELHALYGLGDISFDEMVERAIILDNARKLVPKKSQIESDCCRQFKAATNHSCDQHSQFECPDTMFVRIQDKWAISIKDGGHSGIIINYCPFCGVKCD